MKNNRFFAFGLIALIFALVLAGCKDNPKALAKQTYDLTQAALSNPLKIPGSLLKASSIKKKVSKLSPADRQIYNEELARLTGQGDGGAGTLGGLMGGDLSSLGEALGALGEALGPLLETLGALNPSGAIPGAPAEGTAAESSGSDSKTADSKAAESGKTAESKSGVNDWTWTTVDVSDVLGKSTRNNWIYKIVFGNNMFVVTSNNGSMAYSSDGITWTAIDVGSIFDKSLYGSYGFIPIAFGKDKFIATSHGGQMAYSSDCVTWTAVDVSSIFGDKEVGIISGKDKFLAATEDNSKKAYSSDGIKWTAIDSIYDSIYILACGNDKFIGVDNPLTNGKMAYSSDGAKWTVVEDANDQLNGRSLAVITYCKDKFIAGGVNGLVLYSSDGIKWAAVNGSRIKFSIRDIIYADNKFVAGGTGGRIATSTDGMKWTTVSENILGKENNSHGYDVRTIAYGNGIFVAGGEDGKMAYSTGK